MQLTSLGKKIVYRGVFNLKLESTARQTDFKIIYLSTALQPMQVSCFFANFMMPLFDGVEIDIDLV